MMPYAHDIAEVENDRGSDSPSIKKLMAAT